MKYKMDLQLFATTMTTDTGTLSAEMKTRQLAHRQRRAKPGA